LDNYQASYTILVQGGMYNAILDVKGIKHPNNEPRTVTGVT